MKRHTKRRGTAAAHRRRVDRQAVLRTLLGLRILTWRYRHEPERMRHIGPLAEEFAEAFGVGADTRTIRVSDAIGVAFASIQALHELIEQRRREVAALRRAINRGRRREPHRAQSSSS